MFAASKSGQVTGSTPPPPPTSDPQFNYVTALLTGDGTNGAQNNTFIDSSANNFTIARAGNTTQGSVSPYGGNWSNYFDGSGDYLNPANNAAFAFGTGDFTVECWIYATAASDSPIYEGRADGSTSNGFTITAYSSSVIRIFSGSILISSSGTNYLNQWTHVAVCRVSGTTTLYINGVSVGTSASLGNNSTGSAVIGGGRYAGGTSVSNFFTGYISNLRIVNGTAVYTANFTPSTTPLTAITNTSFLTCQSNTFVDNSANNFAITVNGNTSIQVFNAFEPATLTPISYSGSFDGSGDYCLLPVSANLAFAGDYTLECWVYLNSVTGNQGVYSSIDNSGDTNQGISISFSGTSFYATSYISGNDTITHQNTVTTNQWYHLAMVRSGNITKSYLNGVQSTSTTFSTYSLTQSGSTIGSAYPGTNALNGYISNLRIVKGTALYTSSFTPPTSPLTAITNTQLLTCQSNRFIDNSTNNFAITPVGNTKTTIQNPFGTTSALTTGYSTSVNGGSIYLDGTGDYLLTPANSAITAFGTGDFTIETWVYTTASPHAVGMYLFDTRTSGNPNGWALYLASGDSLVFLYNGAYVASTTSTFYQNRWYHIAYSRSGTSGKLFVNGVVVSSPTDTNNYNQTTVCTVGARYTQDYVLQGYMSNARIVKGTAVYTSAFVPPSAPVTAITNTSLLLNGTNGGIFDNAMMSNYETVGNAQISTSVVKYGTGSMYFDGSGDYLFTPTSNANNLSKFLTGNFTVECWIYPTTSSGDRTIIAAIYTWGAGANYCIEIRSGLLFVQLGNGVTMTSGTTSISANTWTHIALVRSGLTSTTFYVNGVSVATYTSNWTADEDCPLTVGCFNANGGGLSNYWLGYIDDLRITKGYARYVANFTPPTQAFPTY